MRGAPALHVGQPQTLGPVTLFPVWADVRPVRGLLTSGSPDLEVTELDGSPVVGRLAARNHGVRPVLLLEGELLEGGWQTRAVSDDVLVRPHTEIELDVVCVEQGRWSGDTAQRRDGRRVTASVRRTLRESPVDRQGVVWADVGRFEHIDAPTATGSLADHLDRVGAVVPPRLLPGQNGVIVGVAGHPVTLDLFGGRTALAVYLAGIVSAAQLDAVLAGPVAPVPARRARRFARTVESLDLHSIGDATDGAHWRAQREDVSVRALTAGPGLAHLSAVAS